MQKKDKNLKINKVFSKKQRSLATLFIFVFAILSYLYNPMAFNIKNSSIYISITIFLFILLILNFDIIHKWKKNTISIILLPFLVIIAMGLFFEARSWAIWDNGKEYYNQIGKVEKLDKETSKQFSFNKDKNYIVNKEMAEKIADKKMGVGSLSSQYSLGDSTLQKIQYNGENKLFWVFNLEYNSFFTQYSNGSINKVIIVDANKPRESAIILNKDKNNKKYQIKLSQNGYFTQNLSRMVQIKFPTKMMTDFSFELDDNLTPHYIVSVYNYKRGFGLQKVVGIIDINLSNNSMNYRNTNNIPKWIDRITPLSLVQEQINNHGNLVHGLYNFSNKDTFNLTDDSENYIYLNDEPFFISGITSKNSDKSLVGIYAKSLKSNKAYSVSTEGAVEESAKKSAEGKVQNFGYKAINPVIIYMNNKWNYLVPLVDNEQLIKKFALVDVRNYQNVTLFDDIDSFSSAQQSSNSKNTDKKVKSKEELKEELKKNIEAIKKQIESMNSQIEKL